MMYYLLNALKIGIAKIREYFKSANGWSRNVILQEGVDNRYPKARELIIDNEKPRNIESLELNLEMSGQRMS